MVKLSRLLHILLYTCTLLTGGYMCSSTQTLCDNGFCDCQNPFGRIFCSCTGKNINQIEIRPTGNCSVPHFTSELVITDCNIVTVPKGALDDLQQLRSVQLVNIKQLRLQSYGFRWQEEGMTQEHKLRINITNATIQDIPSYTFGGKLSEVVLQGCYIGALRSFALSSIEPLTLVEIRDCNVANVEAQAFKKFITDDLRIQDSRFNVMPSRFFVEVTVNQLFKIENCFFGTIRTLAFKVFNPKEMIFKNNHVNVIESEAFHVKTRGSVVFEANTLGRVEDEIFRGISVEKYILQNKGKQKFHFLNNTVESFRPKSFYFDENSFKVEVGRLALDETCSCDGLEAWAALLPGEQTEEQHTALAALWCREDDKREVDFKYISGRLYYEDYCTLPLQSISFFVIIISATVVSLVIVVGFVGCYIKQKRKWKPVATSAHQEREKAKYAEKEAKKNKSNKKDTPELIKPEAGKGIVVPDGRVYRETEFHVIVEKAEPLTETYIPYRVTRDRSGSHIK